MTDAEIQWQHTIAVADGGVRLHRHIKYRPCPHAEVFIDPCIFEELGLSRRQAVAASRQAHQESLGQIGRWRRRFSAQPFYRRRHRRMAGK